MPTMTAEAITTELDARRQRIRELTETEQALETSLASGRNAIATAIARGRSDTADVVRETTRSDSDSLAETKSALELLNRERADLEAQLGKAQAHEATEQANKSLLDAQRAISVFKGILSDAAEKILAAERVARRAIDEANSNNVTAQSLRGEHVSGMPRVTFPGGIEDLVHEIRSFTTRREVNPAPASQARVA